MPNALRLNELEELVLLAIAHLGTQAYGVTIRQEIEERSGRPVSIAAVYATLERLDWKGLVESWLANPTPERGGRAKKHFRINAKGRVSLLGTRAMRDRMWEGLDTPSWEASVSP